MKESKHRFLTLAALTTIAAGVIHLTNRVIVASSQLKEMLDFSNHNYYKWRFGKIYYTKKGSGSPLLLIDFSVQFIKELNISYFNVYNVQAAKLFLQKNEAKAVFVHSSP